MPPVVRAPRGSEAQPVVGSRLLLDAAQHRRAPTVEGVPAGAPYQAVEQLDRLELAGRHVHRVQRVPELIRRVEQRTVELAGIDQPADSSSMMRRPAGCSKPRNTAAAAAAERSSWVTASGLTLPANDARIASFTSGSRSLPLTLSSSAWIDRCWASS